MSDYPEELEYPMIVRCEKYEVDGIPTVRVALDMTEADWIKYKEIMKARFVWAKVECPFCRTKGVLGPDKPADPPNKCYHCGGTGECDPLGAIQLYGEGRVQHPE